MATRTSRIILQVSILSLLAVIGCGGGAAERDWVQSARVEIAKAVKRGYPDAEAPTPAADRRTEHFVAQDGDSSADGSEGAPWSLAYALSGEADIQAGEIVWLRGGEYEGPFVSELIGAPGAPIVVRGYPREDPVLKACGGDKAILTVNGQYAWMWGFEVTGCGGERRTQESGSHPEDFGNGAAIDVFGSDIRIVEMEIHDAPTGIGCWAGAKRAEIIGNLIYYNGWDGPDRGHGHGIYVQNDVGTKYVRDNVIFSQFGNGIHAYGQTAPLNNLHFTGNVVFMNGQLSESTGLRYNLLVGGDTPVRNGLVERNFTYFPVDQGGANNFGYAGGCEGLNARANYFVGGTALRAPKCRDMELSKNTLFGKLEGVSESQFPDNSYLAEKPARPTAILRSFGWSERRALVIVYNWQGEASIDVEIDESEFRFGDRLAVRSVENLNAEPRVLERIEGEPLEVPLTGWSVQAPVGLSAPPSTLPEFGVFIVEEAPPAE